MSKKIIIIFVIILLIALGLLEWFWMSQKKPVEKKVYKIGLLQMASTVNLNIEGFKAGMAELGYIEGKNVEYTYLNAEGDTKLIVLYAEDLLKIKPDLIFTNTSPATKAAKEVTRDTNIPVVFSMVADPVGAGFVESMKSSGNNLAGTSCAYIDIAPKRLEILKEIDPRIKKVLVFYRPEDKSGGPATTKIKETAPKIGVEIVAKPVESVDEIKQYLDKLEPGEVDALMDPADSMVTSAIDSLVAASLRLKIPLMMLSETEAKKGSFATYGVDYFDLGKQNAPLADKILKGVVQPSQIPIEMPRKFMFVINLATAKKIGLVIPSSILAKANKIIE